MNLKKKKRINKNSKTFVTHGKLNVLSGINIKIKMNLIVQKGSIVLR